MLLNLLFLKYTGVNPTEVNQAVANALFYNPFMEVISTNQKQIYIPTQDPLNLFKAWKEKLKEATRKLLQSNKEIYNKLLGIYNGGGSQNTIVEILTFYCANSNYCYTSEQQQQKSLIPLLFVDMSNVFTKLL